MCVMCSNNVNTDLLYLLLVWWTSVAWTRVNHQYIWVLLTISTETWLKSSYVRTSLEKFKLIILFCSPTEKLSAYGSISAAWSMEAICWNPSEYWRPNIGDWVWQKHPSQLQDVLTKVKVECNKIRAAVCRGCWLYVSIPLCKHNAVTGITLQLYTSVIAPLLETWQRWSNSSYWQFFHLCWF